MDPCPRPSPSATFPGALPLLLATLTLIEAPITLAGPLDAPPIPSGGILSTPAVNSHVVAAPLLQPTASSDFTIEGWVFIPELTSAWVYIPGYLFYQEGLALVRISGQNVGNRIGFFFGRATGTPREFKGYSYDTFWLLVHNAWHHLAYVHDASAGEDRLYFDGILTIPGFEQTTRHGPERPPVDKLAIGGALDERTQDWGFAWDEIRVSSSARYTSNFTPSHTPLAVDASTVALWHFDEAPTVSTSPNAAGPDHALSPINGAATVAGTPTPGLTLSLRYNPFPSLELVLNGQAGRRHRIEQSPDLVHWSIFDETVLTGNAFARPVLDAGAAARFFRAFILEDTPPPQP